MRTNRRFRSKGVTFIEMMVWVALSGVAAYSLASFFRQIDSLSRRALHNQGSFSNKIINLSQISSDIRSASRYSVGSLIRNGGFEIPSADPNWPLYWENTTAGVGGGTLLVATHPLDRRGGFASWLMTAANPAQYAEYTHSDYVTLQPGMDLVLSGWLSGSTDGIIGHIQLIDNTGTVLVSTGTAGAEWEHLKIRFRQP